MSTPRFTPGPWTLELVQNWPFGVIIRAASGDLVLHEDGAAHSTGQKTRHDCENGVGFRWKPRAGGSSREQAIAAVVEQDANARLIAAAPDLYTALEGMERLFAINGEGLMRGKIANEIRAALAKARGEK